MSRLIALALTLMATGQDKPAEEQPALVPVPAPPPPPVPQWLRLGDVPILASTTLDQFVARWGEPVRTGPMNVLLVYRLSPEDELWLTFDDGQPRRLVRAILQHDSSGIRYPRVLLDRLRRSDTRHCAQLDFTRPLTEAEVTAAWGPPDGVQGGPKRDIWTYDMAGRGGANVRFGATPRSSNCED